HQTWLAPGTRIPADRVIVAIDGKQITVDVPITDAYDGKYVNPPGVTIATYTFAGRIEQVGIEHLKVVAPVMPPTPISKPLYGLMRADAVLDGWMSDVISLETENSVSLGDTVKRFTIQDLSILRTTVADGSSGYPLEVSYSGTQILVQRAK